MLSNSEFVKAILPFIPSSYSAAIREELAAQAETISELREAANKLVDYCEAHDWGTMPEPFDSINSLLALLGREGK